MDSRKCKLKLFIYLCTKCREWHITKHKWPVGEDGRRVKPE